jgi:HPt (histidine-containing phosphotransfer) domain-containing protein
MIYMQSKELTLDFEQLKMLSGDSNEFMIEILEMIMEHSPVVLEEMEGLYQAAEFVTLGSTAHQYKSTINILGNPQINMLLKDIENTATQSPETDKLLPLMEDFRQMCNQILVQVEAELEQLK